MIKFWLLDPSACEAVLHLLRAGDESARVVETNLAEHNISQGRFSALARKDPQRADEMMALMQSDIDDVPLGGQPQVSYVALANSLYLCSEVIEELKCADATLEPSRKKALNVLRSLHHMMLTLYARSLR